MRNILIIGGSRFLGPSLTDKLIENGDRVTLFNRGNSYNTSINKLARQVKGDRFVYEEMKLMKDEKFDVVYDMCAYNPEHIKNSMEILGENTEHFVFFS